MASTTARTPPTGEESSDAFDRALEALRNARRVLVITGAGLSADSGLPTYRGVGGLYDTEATGDGIPIEEALSGAMFARDPALTWKYIAEIEAACRGAQPNAGHHALAGMAPHFERFCVLTQNVDGFHRSAGSRDVIEMHGNIHSLTCTACGLEEQVDDYAHIDRLPPICSFCGGVVRPAVILFGEMLPQNAVAQYEEALREGFDLVISVGTSALFPYIAAPVRQAAMAGQDAIEINPQPTPISSDCSIRLATRAADTLSALSSCIKSEM